MLLVHLQTGLCENPNLKIRGSSFLKRVSVTRIAWERIRPAEALRSQSFSWIHPNAWHSEDNSFSLGDSVSEEISLDFLLWFPSGGSRGVRKNWWSCPWDPPVPEEEGDVDDWCLDHGNGNLLSFHMGKFGDKWSNIILGFWILGNRQLQTCITIYKEICKTYGI